MEQEVKIYFFDSNYFALLRNNDCRFFAAYSAFSTAIISLTTSPGMLKFFAKDKRVENV